MLPWRKPSPISLHCLFAFNALKSVVGSRVSTQVTMKRLKSAQQKVKKLKSSFKFLSHSPAASGSDHQLGRQDDRSSTSTLMLHASTSDNSAGQSIPVTSTTLVGTQAGTPDVEDDKKPVPTITVDSEECPTPLPPSKKFVNVKTKNAQHDLVVLHVAYILQKSINLQRLILEIVRLSKNHAVRESSRCSFAQTWLWTHSLKISFKISLDSPLDWLQL